MVVIGITGITTSAEALWPAGRGKTKYEARRVVGKQKMKRQRIVGKVTSVRGQTAYVRTSSGRTVRVMLGPESYWEHHHYSVVPGQRVTVYGWNDPYDRPDWFFASSVSGPGFSLTLTNDVGVPVWVTEYEYARGWYPTYEVYEVWYRPTYYYVPVTAPPPRPVHIRHEAPRDHSKGYKSSPSGHEKKKHDKPKKQERKRLRGRDK